MASVAARAQIANQIVLFGIDNSYLNQIARFDRKLNLLGLTQTTFVGAGSAALGAAMGVGLDAQGRYWTPFDALNDTKVLRMEANGALILPSINLLHNPNFLATAPNGVTYVLSRIPLLSPGPLYAIAASGQVLVSNPAGPELFNFYPDLLEVTPSGEVWIGGGGPAPLGFTLPLLVQVDSNDGAVLQRELFPKPTGYTDPSLGIDSMAAAPDGTMWAMFKGYLTHLDGTRIIKQVKLNNGELPTPLLVDAAGNVIRRAVAKPDPFGTQKVVRYNSVTLSQMDQFQTGGQISQPGGVAIGPSGEDVYVSGSVHLAGSDPEEFVLRLWRISLVTGTRSSVDLTDLGIEWSIPLGDPTGFVWANVRDQQGDADGDGAANRAETLAGSDPFDPTSRPDGPKIYISFAPTTNAIVLTCKDPDGLFEDTGGLDLATASVTASGYGEVLPYLLTAVTSVEVSSPFLDEAKVTFGALPLPPDLKIELEAHIADKTGATAWDWQVTPPGNL